MTPEEIENQFNALSSSTNDYTQERYASFYQRGTETQSLMNSLLSAFKNKIYSVFRSLSSGFRFGIGFVLALFTAGIFAVSVTGTFNTFSSGTLLKSSDINANFATLKAAIEGIPSQPAMRLIYETDVTTATNSITISGLDGNTDIRYHLSFRFVNSSGATCSYYLKPNNDGSASYGWQEISGINASANASRNSGQTFGMGLADASSTATLAIYEGDLIAKSGTARGLIANRSSQINGDLISNGGGVFNTMWNNTASNITSFTIVANQTNGIGAGSHIEVWARR